MVLVLANMVFWAASLIALVVSAAVDLKDRIIPNELVLVVAASGLALGFVSRPGQVGLSLLGAVVVFLGLGTLAHFKKIGGGDAKLIGATMLLVPPDCIVVLLVEIALAGGVLSVVYLAASHTLKRVPVCQVGVVSDPRAASGFGRFLRRERARIAAGEAMPYALAVLGGVTGYVGNEVLRCIFATSSSL